MLSGLLPRPEVTMSMMGITFNVHALCFFAAHGLSGAASTRVGNELGKGQACRPRWRGGGATMSLVWGLRVLGLQQIWVAVAIECPN